MWHLGLVKQKSALNKRKNVDSDQPEHAQSIIRALALHSYIMWYPVILLADREGPDQTARMRRLIWAFLVRICRKTRFRMARPYKVCGCLPLM